MPATTTTTTDGYSLDFINVVKEGGFVDSDIVFRDRVPSKVVKVSDNEVYAVYADPQNEGVYWRQTITADGTGDERYNFTETIEEEVAE